MFTYNKRSLASIKNVQSKKIRLYPKYHYFAEIQS